MKEHRPVEFPAPTGANVNMLPIIMGDHSTIPAGLRQYAPMVDACGLHLGSTVYLSISESRVADGATQRRPGIHTDGTSALGWGGGWGSTGLGLGIYLASTDGACRAWDCEVMTTDAHGRVDEPPQRSVRLKPSTLYHIGDRTPHETLPSHGYRQWFRLVGDAIGGWWEQHSTSNPIGVRPNAPILTGSKFTP